MATRLYYDTISNHHLNPTISSDWYNYESIPYTKYKYCDIIKQNNTRGVAVIPSMLGVATPKNYLMYCFITYPLVGSGTISGTVKGQLLCVEDDEAADLCRAVKIRVVSYDGTVERGVLLSHFPTELTSEFATPVGINRYYPPELDLTPVEYQENDRILIELGPRSFSESDASGGLYFTNDGDTDLPEDETSTSNEKNSWLEFSQNLVFKDRILASQIFSQVVTRKVPKLKASQIFSQIATLKIPKLKASQIYAQILYRKPNTIRKFDSSGNLLMSCAPYGRSIGYCRNPNAVKLDSSGNIYVADTGNHRVQKFNSEGTYDSYFGSSGTGDGEFNGQKDLDFDSSGNIYVVDTGNHRVQKFNSAGEFLAKWGSEGSGDGQFSSPEGVTIDDDNNIYVADTGNHRVQKFTSLGEFTTKWGSIGNGNGEFSSPKGLYVRDSNIYVADTGNHRVQKFDLSGTYVSKFTVSENATPEKIYVS